MRSASAHLPSSSRRLCSAARAARAWLLRLDGDRDGVEVEERWAGGVVVVRHGRGREHEPCQEHER